MMTGCPFFLEVEQKGNEIFLSVNYVVVFWIIASAKIRIDSP